MALTDPESFGQVAAQPQVPAQTEGVLIEKDATNYGEAIQMVTKRLDFWVKESKGDQAFAAYVENLKTNIIENQDEIERNAAIYSGADEHSQNSPSRVYNLEEFKQEGTEAFFVDLQNKLTVWRESSEGMLKDTIRSVQKYMHENKDILATANQGQLVEAQKTEQPFTNGTPEKSPDVVQGVGSGHDGKTLGGAPKDPSTMPVANVEEKEEKEEKKEEVAAPEETKPAASTPTPSGKSLYRSGEKKEFVWYKDDHSKAPTEVKREQGVAASGITEFKPSQAKMEVDNPVPREQGVEESGITEFKPSQAKMDVDNPVPREQGVEESGITEYIKFEESKKAAFKSNLRAVLSAIKESYEI